MSLLRTSLPALAAVLALGAADATTVRTGKPAASQPPARAWATRDQLRECLDTEAGLKERFHAIEAATAAHQRMFDQVEAEDARLLELKSQLDHESDTSINAFNALVKDHNLHVRQLNQDAVDTQPAASAYNTDMIAFNHLCSKLVYRIEDMEAVTNERKRAAARAAAASGPL